VTLTAAGLVAAVMLPAAAVAADTVVPATATGHYYSVGSHTSTNPNYYAGQSEDYRLRNYFVFNMVGLPSPICTATLEAGNPPEGGDPPGGTYSLYEVTTPIVDLTSTYAPGPEGQAIYADLADGTVYGSVTLSDSQVSQNPISVDLNSYGTAALNRALAVGSFAVGGDFASSGHIFGDTPFGSQQLVYQTCTGPKGAAVTLAGLQLAVQDIGPGASISSKVARARAQLEAGHIRAARNTVAAFIAQVRAQAGKTIEAEEARQLIDIAHRAWALL
jgi:hypothetical protein